MSWRISCWLLPQNEQRLGFGLGLLGLDLGGGGLLGLDLGRLLRQLLARLAVLAGALFSVETVEAFFCSAAFFSTAFRTRPTVSLLVDS
jgi:hypothetical protein